MSFRSLVASVLSIGTLVAEDAVQAQSRLQIDPQHHEARLVGGPDGGIFTLERAEQITGPWWPVQNRYITNASPSVPLPNTSASALTFLRGVVRDLGSGSDSFQNLVEAYGVLSTVAGAGGVPADVNKWDPAFEGGLATEALLSNPHFSVGSKPPLQT